MYIYLLRILLINCLMNLKPKCKYLYLFHCFESNFASTCAYFDVLIINFYVTCIVYTNKLKKQNIPIFIFIPVRAIKWKSP